MRLRGLTAMLLFAALPVFADDVEISGYVSAQNRYFVQQELDSRQHGNYVSLAAEPEFYLEKNAGNDVFRFKPFVRLDQYDSKRTHADVREASWLHVSGNSEWLVGVSKEYWGVTESVHLVDIINQTDLVENPDGEQKLGQPMLKFSTVQDWGIVDLFVMPWFRERTFAGKEGRPRSSPRVDSSLTEYDSGSEQHHVDVAARWINSYGDWDIGLSGFYGTSRDPDFIPKVKSSGEVVLAPFYPVIGQIGLDIQATKGDWLWKLETIYRNGQGEENYIAADAGFEYTLVGVAGTQADVGLLLEYLYDDRSKSIVSPFDDDIFAGMRLTLNDAQSTELLFGVVQDRHESSRFFNLEASRRLGESFVLSIQGRFWNNIARDDPLYSLRDDDYIEIDLKRYF
ncbi:MAG: hypothetical protein KZQ58_07765 [gamma proteobacterium symbiont of Bathyaustriella thionipta]|nr:hypothetical protein [gamma proteobacterium symbiont of Bathyaustriella thionipta]